MLLFVNWLSRNIDKHHADEDAVIYFDFNFCLSFQFGKAYLY